MTGELLLDDTTDSGAGFLNGKMTFRVSHSMAWVRVFIFLLSGLFCCLGFSVVIFLLFERDRVFFLLFGRGRVLFLLFGRGRFFFFFFAVWAAGVIFFCCLGGGREFTLLPV